MHQHLHSVSGYGCDSPATRPDTPAKLREFEKRAWRDYQSHVRQLDFIRTTISQDTFPAQRILSVLTRIGVDADFCMLLFGLASQAWQELEIDSDKVVHLHPNLQRDIADVREGLLIQSEKKMALRSGPVFLTPQETYDQL